MNILLDTHILLWALNDDPKLTSYARNMIDKSSNIYVSAASIWEISIKQNIGKLEADVSVIVEHIDALGIEQLAINWQHAANVNQLPLHHKDPFDRMLIAQAISEPLVLLTNDQQLKPYSELVQLI